MGTDFVFFQITGRKAQHGDTSQSGQSRTVYNFNSLTTCIVRSFVQEACSSVAVGQVILLLMLEGSVSIPVRDVAFSPLICDTD